MNLLHLVRTGSMGWIGRFLSADGAVYPRGRRIVLRTRRGLEVGEVLSSPAIHPFATASHSDSGAAIEDAEPDGSILRAMTTEDHLLEARLIKNRDDALAACGDRIAELGLGVALLDVEHLFDGRTLIFYFLGETTPELEAITNELAETYDAKVQFRKFAETLNEGCGPGCGTDKATGGGGCGSCSSGCSIAAACSTRKK